MVEVKKSGAKDKSKVLTSDRAKYSGDVDTETKISADKLQGRSRYEEGQGSSRPRRAIMS